MSASSSAIRTRIGSLAHGRKPSERRGPPTSPLGCCGQPGHTGTPPYPNRQRERIQNPRSVRSSRTGGTDFLRPADRTAATCRSLLASEPSSAPLVGEPPAPAPRLASRGGSRPSVFGLAVSALLGDPPGPTRLAEYRVGVTEPAAHMTPEEFRQHGHEVVDWIADYWCAASGRFPVRSQVAPGDVRASLPAAAPEQGEPFDAVLADLDRVVAARASPTGSTPASSPTSRPTPPGRRCWATWSRAGLGVQGMLWATSPACTELETHVMDWLAELLDLPARSAPPAPAAASSRTRAPAPPCRPARRAAPGQRRAARCGTASTPRGYTVYTSAQAHSSVEKAVRIAGLGTDAVRIVEVDGDLAMRPGGAGRAARARRRPRLHRRCWSAPRSAPRRPRRSTRSPRSARSARSTASGCTSTPRTPGVAAVCPGAALAATPASSTPTRYMHRPAQVAAHRLRLRRVLGRRPGRADRRAVGPAGVPAQRRHRVRRGHRLPRLAGAAGPAVPGAEAVVRAALVRRRGAARAHPRRTSRWPRSSPAGPTPTSGSSWSRRTRSRWSASGRAGPTTWTPTSPP